jgi:hypothetical protein
MENTSNKKRVTVRLISSNCKQRNNKMEQQYKDDVDDSSVSASDKDDRSYEDGDTDEEEEELVECADTGVTGDEQEDEEAEEEDQDEGAGKDYDEDQGGGNEDATEKDDFEYEEFETIRTRILHFQFDEFVPFNSAFMRNCHKFRTIRNDCRPISEVYEMAEKVEALQKTEKFEKAFEFMNEISEYILRLHHDYKVPIASDLSNSKNILLTKYLLHAMGKFMYESGLKKNVCLTPHSQFTLVELGMKVNIQLGNKNSIRTTDF